MGKTNEIRSGLKVLYCKVQNNELTEYNRSPHLSVLVKQGDSPVLNPRNETKEKTK